MTTTSARPVSRRAFLGYGLGAAALTPLLASCSGGLSTSGSGSGGGTSVSMFSSQFSPVDERSAFQKILSSDVSAADVSFNSVDAATFTSTLQAQLQAKTLKTNLLGALHTELAAFQTSLEPVDDVLDDLKDAGISKDILELPKYGGSTSRYVPWNQVTYFLCANKKALEWLPSGADVNALSYDEFLQWAKNAAEANGKPVFGIPAGPNGLLHRFFQGYLLPSFTGAQVTKFTSSAAVDGWQWMKEFWKYCNPASTSYDYMQEPLARGEVLVAWDHAARLIDAPKDNPDDWIMAPAPTGPEGLGYMLVVTGLAIPKGAKGADAAKSAISDLMKSKTQLDVLQKLAFFPIVKADQSGLSGAIALEAGAVAKQQAAKNAIVSLPPTGTGAKDGEVSNVFKTCFQQICLQNADIKSTIDDQGKALQTLLDGLKIPCWAPDPVQAGELCKVG